MFSGIVEAVEPVINLVAKDRSLRIEVRRPSTFDDIKIGDSISVNGTCLTLEDFQDDRMIFTVGLETLQILHLNLADVDHSHFVLRRYPVNLERSLKFGDRIHGHYVTGHVDNLARVVESRSEGDCCVLKLEIPASRLIWKKGSMTVHGVSLTINAIANFSAEVWSPDGIMQVEFCLIPETLTRTNLSQFVVGDHLNIELDWMAKGLLEGRRDQRQPEGSL